MKPGRIIAIVVGVLIVLPAFGAFIGGGVLTTAYLIERSDDGYFDETLDRIATSTAAITTGDVDLAADPGPPDWVFDLVDATVRIRAEAADTKDLFVGIAPTAQAESYLNDVAREEIVDIEPSGDVDYDTKSGTAMPAPPADQTFWVASATGGGEQELVWDVAEGEWTAVLMNADASPGIVADVTVGLRSGAVLAIGIGLLVLGAVFIAIAVAIILIAARRPSDAEEPAAPAGEATPVMHPEPVALSATLDEPLSPWLWLVKWFLAIPHLVVLAFLWVGFAVMTFIAGVAILFSGRYPRGVFDFNLGVLRWTWRVTYYAFYGGLGTDRYPPFSLNREDTYPATLDIDYPERLSQGLVLVKWWLLAVPHYLIVGLLIGGSAAYGLNERTGNWESYRGVWSGGLVGLLVLIAAVILLFTSRYPRSLFDLIIGLNRWVYRVLAYAALMTDRYPPFRLDQGGTEPDAQLPPPPMPPTVEEAEFSDRN
ncbi:MAG: DUF4389 domain-containing protein [bacterium]|nr:DUF4389 domain-containing protein [bacterium]